MGKRKSLASALRQAKDDDKRVKVAIQKQERAMGHTSKTDSSAGGQKWAQKHSLVPFEKGQKILFVGEGNFSFAASCIENHLEHGEDVVATSFDDEATVHNKYPDAAVHITTIEDCCGTVKHAIDATKLEQHFPNTHFDVVIFMFPHVAAGIADEDRNILTNQKMLSSFFKTAQEVLAPEGTIAVSLAVSKTYDLWDIRGLAKAQGLKVKTSGPFQGTLFPGYEHRRTQGFMDDKGQFRGGKGEERSARWTIFSSAKTPSDSIKSNNKPSRKSDRDSDDDQD